jgi:hypothetical protein
MKEMSLRRESRQVAKRAKEAFSVTAGAKEMGSIWQDQPALRQLELKEDSPSVHFGLPIPRVGCANY